MKGTITRLFRNCPKPSGWFGCFFEPTGAGHAIKLTGTVQVLGVQTVEEGMQLDVEVRQDPKWENVIVSGTVATSSKRALIAYLSSDNFKGIGPVKARKLYDAFGDKVLETIERDPDAVRKAGFSDQELRVLTMGISNQTLNNQLQKILYGLSQSDFKRIANFYRDKLADSDQVRVVVDRLKANPYTLFYDMRLDMTPAFSKKLYASLDDYAMRSGMSITDPARIDAAIDLVTREMISDTNGAFVDLADLNTKRFFDDRMDQVLRVRPDTKQVFDAAIPDRVRPKLVAFQEHKCLYDPILLDAETTCAGVINDRLASRPNCRITRKQIDEGIYEYEQSVGHPLHPLQKDAVRMSLSSGISVVTGGPGRGKTSVIDCIVHIWKLHSDASVILSAPTGAAAKRMYQAIPSAREWRARTITYRLLRRRERSGTQLCIIDEASMLCLRDAARTLDHFRDCQIVFVGDADQLPAVENGQFFKDLCASGTVPITKLLKCYRTAPGSAAILDNADRVNAGGTPQSLHVVPDCFELDCTGPNGMDIADNEAMGHAARAYLDKHAAGVALKDMCLISPMRDTVNRLNEALREVLNPENPSAAPTLVGTLAGQEYAYRTPGFPIPEADPNTKYPLNLRVNDRVVITKNMSGYDLVNGDTGRIVDYRVPEAYSFDPSSGETPYITFQTDQGRRVFLYQEDFQHVSLAYAVTVHKAQGCEYPHIMVVLPVKLSYPALVNNGFTCRNLLYTAMTRAKLSVRIFGGTAALSAMMANPMKPRPSLLRERLDTPALVGVSSGFDFSLYSRVLDMEPELEEETTMADDEMFYDDGEDPGLPDTF